MWPKVDGEIVSTTDQGVSWRGGPIAYFRDTCWFRGGDRRRLSSMIGEVFCLGTLALQVVAYDPSRRSALVMQPGIRAQLVMLGFRVDTWVWHIFAWLYRLGVLYPDTAQCPGDWWDELAYLWFLPKGRAQKIGGRHRDTR